MFSTVFRRGHVQRHASAGSSLTVGTVTTFEVDGKAWY